MIKRFNAKLPSVSLHSANHHHPYDNAAADDDGDDDADDGDNGHQMLIMAAMTMILCVQKGLNTWCGDERRVQDDTYRGHTGASSISKPSTSICCMRASTWLGRDSVQGQEWGFKVASRLLLSLV